MTTRVGSGNSATPERAQAVSSFFREDPARILAVATSLRGERRFLSSTIRGSSMGAELPSGSRIRIELDPRSGYVAGELVAFFVEAKLVVHRIVYHGRSRAAHGYLLARGDAAILPDVPLRQAQILGPVTGVWRDGRWTTPIQGTRRFRANSIVSGLLLVLVSVVLEASPRGAKGITRIINRAAWVLRMAADKARRRPRPARE